MLLGDAFGEFEGGEEEDLSYFWEEFKKAFEAMITMTKVIAVMMENQRFFMIEVIDVKCFEVGQGSGVHFETVVGQESGTREDIVCEAEVHVKRNGSVESKSGSDIQIVHESPTVLNLETGSSFVSNAVVAEANGSAEEAAVASENNSDLENPLDWDDFDSAVEIQVLGLERLKAELRAHGLKCGGMLTRACF
ncbi:hypothetical protein MKW92_053181 [Papaver armeniacum]|nr:hypothetical protein MKW92_053181 [Papaver armeniacum]